MKDEEKRDYIEEIRTNPLVFCADECSTTECPKHINGANRSWLLLLAHMKATPYCLDEDPKVYKEVNR